MPYFQRKSPRLQGYDYSQSGAYFITICTHLRQYFFGEINDEEMTLSSAGEIATICWNSIPDHYPDVDLDAFVVMPNHVHGIIVFAGNSEFKTIWAVSLMGIKALLPFVSVSASRTLSSGKAAIMITSSEAKRA